MGGQRAKARDRGSRGGGYRTKAREKALGVMTVNHGEEQELGSAWRAGVGQGVGGGGGGNCAFNEKTVACAKAFPDVRLVTVLDKTYLIMDTEMCFPCK